MKKLFILLLITAFGCRQHDRSDYIANINGINICSEEIDSIASNKIYNLKKDILKTIIRKRVIESESFKRKIKKKKLIELEVHKKALKVRNIDFKKYINENNILSENIDSINIIRYLQSQKRTERYICFTDSLIKKSDLEISLFHQFPRKLNIDSINYFNLTKITKNQSNTVYIISDFDCSHCKEIEPEVSEMIETYSEQFDFRYVFYSDFISKKALALNAVSKQSEIKNLYSRLHKVGQLKNDSSIFNLIKDLPLDKEQFIQDYNNPVNLKQFLRTKKYLMDNEIYVTPTFIINDVVLEDEFAFYQLKSLLKSAN